MNRQILFRGKRLDKDEWVYGYYVLNNKGSFIETMNLEEDYDIINSVDITTVGQYTGLIDQNGVKIFEGDQLEFVHHESYFKGVVYFAYGSFYLKRNSSDIIVYTHLKDAVNKLCAYVIGNIYDSPENK